MSSDMTVPDLEIMSTAHNYRRWLFEQISPYIGQRILEIGAGIGNYTEFLMDRELVVCLDVHPKAISLLGERFRGEHHIMIYQGDVSAPDVGFLSRHCCDTCLCLNVLEHIRDDTAALRNLASILLPGSLLLLIVPALPCLFGTVDRSLGHYRRYQPSSLRSVLLSAGYRVERMWWLNSPGVLAWFLNNRVLRRTQESPTQIMLYDRIIVPWLRVIEGVMRPPIGLSLVCVAKLQ